MVAHLLPRLLAPSPLHHAALVRREPLDGLADAEDVLAAECHHASSPNGYIYAKENFDRLNLSKKYIQEIKKILNDNK